MPREKSFSRGVLSYWKIALEVALLAFFCFYTALHTAQLREVLAKLSTLGLAVCILVYSAAHFLAVLATHFLLKGQKIERPYLQLLGFYFRRLPAKYLPGGIWHNVGRGGDLISTGVPAPTVGKLVALEQMLAVWWSGFLGLCLLAASVNGQLRWIAAAVALGWFALTHLGILMLSRRSTIAPLVTSARSVHVSFVYIAGWSLLATAFCTYLYMVGLANVPVLRTAASYLISWMIGALAIFSPQGMGIFELSMTKTLGTTGLSQPELVWLIGSYRIIVLIADLGAWCTWTLLHQITRRSEARA
jgi:hypothetical protein